MTDIPCKAVPDTVCFENGMQFVISVLFVCTGNICRSPTADGVFRDLVQKAGLADQIMVDSCGTTAFHVGEAPDPRSCKMAISRGSDLSMLRARKLIQRDFSGFDYILAMDDGHLGELARQCPAEYQNRIKLFLDFHPERRGQSVPDPYYGGALGFTQVFEMIEETAQALLIHIRQQHDI
ncbi:MAG: low molecular weight protein-tyrosine-phosphatase [Pseudomonadota bacterium]